MIEMTMELSEEFAGPETEMDKLMAIDWKAISADGGGGTITDFYEAERTSQNSVILRFFSYDLV